MERRLPAIWSCCFVSWTKDDHMGPYSFGNCLCICTSPSTTRPTPAWSLLYYKIVLKNPLLLVWCVLFFIFNCNASFQREMKPDLNAECMHSDKRRAIQHMDAKCPFTAPIQTQYPPPRGDAWHGGHCPAVHPGRGGACLPPFHPSPFPMPHCAMGYSDMSASVAWIWGTGDAGLWRGGRSYHEGQAFY